MYYHISDLYSPSFNLATEEYLLKESSEEFFMLYRNRPSVIIGKHQDAYSEINQAYVKDNNINVYRRITGGGAVYHDLGNINYSFITTGCNGCLVDLPKYIGLMTEVLTSMGIYAHMDKRNAIYADKFKISGTACHVWRNRSIHHGTILFETDLDKLNRCLKAGHIGYKPGMVASIRSVVCNVKNLLDKDIDINEFVLRMVSWVTKYLEFQGCYKFTDGEISQIKSLEKEKYSTQKWNYDYQESSERLII